ncbi:unnamed protein product [Musa textilis]
MVHRNIPFGIRYNIALQTLLGTRSIACQISHKGDNSLGNSECITSEYSSNKDLISGVWSRVVQGLGISIAMMALQKNLGPSKWSSLVVRTCGRDLRVPDLPFFWLFRRLQDMFLPLYRKTCFFSHDW